MGVQSAATTRASRNRIEACGFTGGVLVRERGFFGFNRYPERLLFNSQTSEQTVLTQNLRSILTQLKMSVLFWLNGNRLWHFVVTLIWQFYYIIFIYIISYILFLFFCNTLEIPYNEKLKHQRPLFIERERGPLHILLVAMRCYAHYMTRAVSLSLMPCE